MTGEIRRCPKCDMYTLRLRRIGMRTLPYVWYCDTCDNPMSLLDKTFYKTERD